MNRYEALIACNDGKGQRWVSVRARDIVDAYRSIERYGCRIIGPVALMPF